MPLAIVLALVAGVTFVSQFTGTQPTKVVRPPASEEPLRFVTTRVSWDDDDPDYVREFELGEKGRYDFWFRNPYAEPVRVTWKGPPGAELMLGMLPKTAWGETTDFKKAPEFAEGQIMREGQAVEVPAADPQQGSAVGAIRLTWRSAKLGPQKLAADLALQPAGKSEAIRRLEVPVMVVPAVRVQPDWRNVPDLAANGEQTVEFLCWTATRDGFELASEDQPHPCFRVAWKPLDAEERRRLGEKQNSRVRAGYRVSVTVAERAGKDRLDLGPYVQKIRLRAKGVEEPVVLEVSGLVRGEAYLVTPGAKDRIDLGTFPRSRGISKPLVLGVEPPARDLRLVSSPPGLQVKLEPRPAEDGQKRWDLEVTVPANHPGGPLPPGSAVVLEVIGPETRRWVIPVLGQAIQ